MKWITLKDLNSDLRKLRGQHLIVECELYEFKIKTSLKGKRFGVFVVKDEESTAKFFLFGDVFKRLQHLNLSSKRILIRGLVKKLKYSNALEFKIDEISELN